MVLMVVGGLNFQIEHHLFPNVCHVHYRKISSIVRRTAREYGLPYKSTVTFFGALQGHARLLKQLGLKPVAAPVSKSSHFDFWASHAETKDFFDKFLVHLSFLR